VSYQPSQLGPTTVGSISPHPQSNVEAWAAGASPLRSFLIKLSIVEFLVAAAAAYFGSVVYHRLLLLYWPNPEQYLMAAMLLAVMLSLVSLTLQQFAGMQKQPRHRFLWNGAKAVALAFSFFLSIMFLFKTADAYSRGTFLCQLACVGIAVLALRATAHSRLQSAIAAGRIESRRVVLIGDQGRCSQFAHRLRLTGIRTVRAFAPPEHCGPEISSVLSGATATTQVRELVAECRLLNADDIVVLADEKQLGNTHVLALALSELPVDIHVVPVGAEDLIGSAWIAEFGDVVTMQVVRRPLTVTDRIVKRGFDMAAAVAGLTLLSPLLIAVMIVIKLDSPGPIFFRQTRHGFNNEPIRVIKFRTMTVMEDGDDFKQAVRGDERITRIGRLLRRTNIDELPQLLNVLFGDMSIVGPRPHATAHNRMFEQLISPFSRRHSVKPGITGWAQVNGYRGETDTIDKMRRRVECDLYYIDNWSILFDLKIIGMTLFSKSSYLNAY
jgi:Undecaprenyl-phosphate glucose phosphotransferase